MYGILLESTKIEKPYFAYFSTFLVLLSIYGAVTAGKKFALIKHDIEVAKRRGKENSFRDKIRFVMYLPMSFTLLSVFIFILMENIFLKSISLFFSVILGHPGETALTVLFVVLLIPGTYILVKTRMNQEKYKNMFLSKWGKRFSSISDTSLEMASSGVNTAVNLSQNMEKKMADTAKEGLKKLRPPHM